MWLSVDLKMNMCSKETKLHAQNMLNHYGLKVNINMGGRGSYLTTLIMLQNYEANGYKHNHIC